MWKSETDGALGKLLRAVPAGTAVVSVFGLPMVDRNLPISRFSFLNLSMFDAIKEGAFGWTGLSAEEVARRQKEQRRILIEADGIITPSTYASDSIAAHFDVPREKFTPFGYGATFATNSVSQTDPARYARANILFVGRDFQRKGGLLVYEAFKQVRCAIPHATLTIVGPEEAPVQGDGIHFVGFVDKTTRIGRRQLLQCYGRASVFCMPTMCEPWGLVFGEAAEAGLPIISFREWSLPDIVVDGTTGILVDGRSVDGLTAALTTALANPARLQQMGLASAQRAQNVLSWPHCVDRILSRVAPALLEGRQAVPLRPPPADPANGPG